MRRNIIILIMAFTALISAHPTDAQQADKVYRIGILTGGSVSTAKRNIDPFLEGLRELGYVEGKNLVIEIRHADRKRDRLPGLAAELVRAKVDVILVVGPRPIAVAKQATSTIPIVAGGGWRSCKGRAGGQPCAARR